eukprot:144053_1
MTHGPTDTPTTAYPTLSTRRTRRFVLALFGDFDALQQYVNGTNSSIVVWAKGVIRRMISITIHPQLSTVIITIHSVGRGSVEIDYSLEVDVVSLLDLAEVMINSTVEVRTDGNFTFPVLSNTEYTANPTQMPTDSPTNKPTQSPLPGQMTHDPTPGPTKEPTTSIPTTAPTTKPSKPPLPDQMTHDPTSGPSMEPTTRIPTMAPTPQDIDCNHDGIATTVDGEYEYYLHIDETS